MNRYKIVIGDWSKDGHNQSEDWYFKTNKTATEVRQAYWESVKKTGICFNGDHHCHEDKVEPRMISHTLLASYEDDVLSTDVVELLLDLGLPEGLFQSMRGDDGQQYVAPCDLPNLLMWFIGLSMEDFIWKADDGVECINGWWEKDLNVQWGYGLFGC